MWYLPTSTGETGDDVGKKTSQSSILEASGESVGTTHSHGHLTCLDRGWCFKVSPMVSSHVKPCMAGKMLKVWGECPAQTGRWFLNIQAYYCHVTFLLLPCVFHNMLPTKSVFLCGTAICISTDPEASSWDARWEVIPPSKTPEITGNMWGW